MSVINVHIKSFKFKSKWHFSHTGFVMSLNDVDMNI